ncbi:hypothetical protein K438DRAFT_1757828 [Mycena galopus ATCC 62051]|nr:hypothetical protein K438DRAFT_1757828 [Mycena galopus ATCC 62051]
MCCLPVVHILLGMRRDHLNQIRYSTIGRGDRDKTENFDRPCHAGQIQSTHLRHFITLLRNEKVPRHFRVRARCNAYRVKTSEKAKHPRAANEEVQAAEQAVADAQAQQSNSSRRVCAPRARKNDHAATNGSRPKSSPAQILLNASTFVENGTVPEESIPGATTSLRYLLKMYHELKFLQHQPLPPLNTKRGLFENVLASHRNRCNRMDLIRA